MKTWQDINKRLFAGLSVEQKEQLGSVRRYRPWGQRGQGNAVVAMVDGTTFHGGLCDRWKGIVSLYAWCKATKRDFRLYYTWPFPLTLFQEPAQYDWHIDSADICRRLGQVRLMRLTGDATLDRMQHLPPDKQIHAYANRDWVALINHTFTTKYQWGELFQELFRPTPWVQDQLKSYPEEGSYVAVSFRMQNLLGDYHEYNYQPADRQRQQDLIALCRRYVQSLYETENCPVLVTSDSIRLCEVLGQSDYVYTSSLRGVHPDTEARADTSAYGKAFVDFYALARARKIYAPVWEGMYASDFPYYASQIRQIPFVRERS